MMSVSAADSQTLRMTARRTWRFFETFVTAADNMLPPDNFQEDPAPALAHRTSPTNLGLYLLSIAAARDFGWLGTTEAAERLEMTLATMAKLGRFRGHFYNWYDTRDLRSLDPPYVSTVDSGNLAGHLIVLANACGEWTVVAPTAAQRLAGIADALDLAREATDQLRDGRRTLTVTWHQLDDAVAALSASARQAQPDLQGIAAHLAELGAQVEITVDIASAFASERGDDTGADMLFWVTAVRRSIESHQEDIRQSSELAILLAARLASLAAMARSMALEMGYGFLLDPVRKLLSIGYRVTEGTLDPSCYDLLASEARLASFIAIAKGDVPARHWFHLGRAVTPIASGAALISWSGSMFEYFMPSLVMRAPAGSLLEQTDPLIVRRQIAMLRRSACPGASRNWAYNVRDLELHLPILKLRRARPRVEARPGRQRCGRAVRNGACQHGQSGRGGTQFDHACRRRRMRSLWVLRGTGLYAEPTTGEYKRRDRACFHGAPSGHDYCGRRRCVAGWCDARALPCRTDGPGDRTAAAGRHAARRCRIASLGRRTPNRLARCCSLDRKAEGGWPPRTPLRSPPICYPTAATL